MTASPTIRPLRLEDMPSVASLQTTVFQPHFHETEDELASRLAVAAPFCWAAVDADGGLMAYILSHPWLAGSPPAIGTHLQPPPATDNWFIHDLAIGPTARGLGLGRDLVRAASRAAMAAGLVRGDLVAVQGAWSFWNKLGYEPQSDLPPALAAKVAGYGEDARYMTARLADLRV